MFRMLTVRTPEELIARLERLVRSSPVRVKRHALLRQALCLGVEELERRLGVTGQPKGQG